MTDEIHARSRGVPRVINVICDATLVFGYAEERRQIDTPLIEDVLAELDATGVLPSPAEANAETAAAAGPVAGRAATAVRRAAPPPIQAAAPVSRARDADREAALDAREQALLQRERELAEQRRILAEEYRLLRSRHAPAVPAAAPVRVQLSGSARPAPVRFDTGGRERWWSRVKRLMLGVSTPATD